MRVIAVMPSVNDLRAAEESSSSSSSDFSTTRSPRWMTEWLLFLLSLLAFLSVLFLTLITGIVVLFSFDANLSLPIAISCVYGILTLMFLLQLLPYRQFFSRASILHRWHQLLWTTGVSGVYFMDRLWLTELGEIAIQTYCGYEASRRIPDPRIHLVYGILVFCNCLSSPLILIGFQYRKQRQSSQTSLVHARLSCLVMNLVVAFVWGPVIQVLLSISSILHVVMPDVQASTTRFFIQSSTDVVLYAVPFVMLWINMTQIKHFLHHAAPSVIKENNANGAYKVSTRLTKLLWTAMVVHGSIVLFGCLRALVAIDQQVIVVQQVAAQCQVVQTLWFQNELVCDRLVIDCKELQLADGGNQSELHSILLQFDRRMVLALTMQQCTGLQVPTLVQGLHQAQQLEIINSTVVHWYAQMNALAQLQRLRLSNVTYSNTPEGLVTPASLGASFSTLELTHVNAHMVFDHVQGSWLSIRHLSCVDCGFSRLPTAIRRMKNLETLTLDSNQLTELTYQQVLSLPALTSLSLVGNPIETLPSAICGSQNLTSLNIQETSITTVPDSNCEKVTFKAHGAPICSTTPIPKGVDCSTTLIQKSSWSK